MAAVIASLLATLQLLLAAVGPHVLLERAVPDESVLGPVTGDASCARWVQDNGAWRCPGNLWRVRISPTMDFGAIGDTEGATDQDEYDQAVALTTLVHELAHVYDAMDDGRFNGSRGHPRPDRYVDALQLTHGRAPWEPTPWYCWAAAPPSVPFDAAATDLSRGEWYACEVARTGRLQ